MYYFRWNALRKEFGLNNKYVKNILLLSIISTFAEVMGIGIFYPIIQYVQSDGNLTALSNESKLWHYAINFLKIIDIDLSLSILLTIAFSFFLIRQVVSYQFVVYFVTIKNLIEKKLRDRMFSLYFDANSEYHDKVPVGLTSNLMTAELRSSILGITVPLELITQIIIFISFVPLLLMMSWEITIIAFFIIIVSSLVPGIWIKRSKKVGFDLVDTNNKMSEFLIERLNTPNLSRLTGTEKAELNQFEFLTKNRAYYYTLSNTLQAKASAFLEPVVIFLSLSLLYFSVTKDMMSLSEMGVYVVILIRLLPVSKGVISKWQRIRSLLGSIERVDKKCNEMSRESEKDTGCDLFPKKINNIKFDNVSYSYPVSKEEALSGISLSINSNSLNVIVGPSGSGKSTLIELLPRLRGPNFGTIKINNTLLDNFTLYSLRRNISFLPQEPKFFDETVIEHIRLGKNNASNEEIYNAANLAGVSGFIDNFENGYYTNVGENGSRLSGGQRKKIDLARVIVSESPIIILDEPTSGMDYKSEKDLFNNLSMIKKSTGATIIIISHQLMRVSIADQVIVINDGKVEETGSHSELIKNGNWYAKSWHSNKVS